MPSSFTLTPTQAATFRPLPGRILLRVLPAKTMEGSIHIPETVADSRQKEQALREGEVVAVNLMPHPSKELRTRLVPEEVERLKVGAKVLYLTHLDEVENDYVVVLVGQIVGVMG